jgi:hypothetical protein
VWATFAGAAWARQPHELNVENRTSQKRRTSHLPSAGQPRSGQVKVGSDGAGVKACNGICSLRTVHRRQPADRA